MKSRKRRRRRLIKSKITSQRYEDLRFSRIYNSGRISGATDKGITIEACYFSTPGARLSNSPWKLGPSIVIVEIQDHIVIRIVICIGPNRFFETWPPIYRGQERPARDRLRLSQLSTSLFSTCIMFRLVGLNLYLLVHLAPSSPDPKSFI
jgi:hypothetical protein